jgi:hypothetical protein
MGWIKMFGATFLIPQGFIITLPIGEHEQQKDAEEDASIDIDLNDSNP